MMNRENIVSSIEDDTPQDSPVSSGSITKHPVFSEFNETLALVEEAEDLLKQLKLQLEDKVKALPSKIGENKDLRDAVFSHLYWSEERFQGTFLLKAFNMVTPAHAKKGSTNVLKGIIIDVACTQCHEIIPITITSRSALASFNPQGKICDVCREKNQHNSNEWYTHYLQEKAQRLYELQMMPYREYLKTPEWQETRRRAMKRAGYRCQVCNSYGIQLNVHHRTYKRRGQELNQDLITLCATCHQIFHENGKLANGGRGE